LKFSGGSVDDYATFSTSTTKLLIRGTESPDELRHRSVALQSTEAFDGFEDASGDPAFHLESVQT
jgi:hypothetical protein